MKPVTLNIVLLAFLLPIAAALKCYRCQGRNSDTCEQEEEECPAGERCLTISEDYNVNGTYHSVYKGCSGDMPCDKKLYSKAKDDLYILTNIKCCDTDLCNDQFYEMPEDEKPNGAICPNCVKLNTLEECKANNVIKCQEKGDKCVSFSAEVENPEGVALAFTVKGCMSALECTKLPVLMIGAKILHAKMFECTNPPSNEEKEEEKS